MRAAIRGHGRVPGRLAGCHHGVILELLAAERVVVQIDQNVVALLDQADRAADSGLRTDMADHKADRTAGEAAVRHQADNDAALAAERCDARGGVQHFGHAGTADRAFIADNDHIAILEMVGVAVQHLEQLLLAVEHLCAAGEDVVLEATFDTGEFQHGAEFR